MGLILINNVEEWAREVVPLSITYTLTFSSFIFTVLIITVMLALEVTNKLKG